VAKSFKKYKGTAVTASWSEDHNYRRRHHCGRQLPGWCGTHLAVASIGVHHGFANNPSVLRGERMITTRRNRTLCKVSEVRDGIMSVNGGWGPQSIFEGAKH
jgi:hypothetical protein